MARHKTTQRRGSISISPKKFISKRQRKAVNKDNGRLQVNPSTESLKVQHETPVESTTPMSATANKGGGTKSSPKPTAPASAPSKNQQKIQKKVEEAVKLKLDELSTNKAASLDQEAGQPGNANAEKVAEKIVDALKGLFSPGAKQKEQPPKKAGDKLLTYGQMQELLEAMKTGKEKKGEKSKGKKRSKEEDEEEEEEEDEDEDEEEEEASLEVQRI